MQAHLIHMLAKHETAMKASSTVLGREPARLKTFVIKMRSMLVLLRADDMVKPPMSNMIVGENMMEKTYLQKSISTMSVFLQAPLLCGIRRGQLRASVFGTYNTKPYKQQWDKHGGHE
jgi:hypothetical protein